MRKTVSRFLPSRSKSSGAIKKSLGIDDVNLVQEFYIELDEPHKNWKPGETITGVIVLDLKKNTININIGLMLKGYIKIKQSTTTTTPKTKPLDLFEYTCLIYGEQGNHENELVNGLSKGEHRFPFSMKLPKKNIYTSISFEKGCIAYYLKASINHNFTSNTSYSSSLSVSSPSSPTSSSSSSSFTLNGINSSILINGKSTIQSCERGINILVPINVAKIPKPQTKYAFLKVSEKKLMKTISSTSTVNSSITQFSNASENSNESCTCQPKQSENFNQSNNCIESQNSQFNPPTPTTSKSIASESSVAPIRLGVDIPESGFLRGELIPIKIKVSHYKPIHSPNGIIATLTRICRVDNGPDSRIQSFRKDLSQSITPLYIDPETLTSEIRTSLRVPVEAFPTIIGSNIVTFQYYVEVLANISSKNLISNSINSQNSTTKKLQQNILFDFDLEKENKIENSNGGETGIINVDKFKRAKSYLGLNTEIIVGTERIYKKNLMSNLDSRSKEIKVNSDNLVEESLIESGNSFVDISIGRTSISPLSIDNIPNGNSTTPESSELNGIPPTIDNTNNRHKNEFEIIHLQNGNNAEHINEKEALRLREEALLPSEPPLISEEFETPVPIYSTEDNFKSEDYNGITFNTRNNDPSNSIDNHIGNNIPIDFTDSNNDNETIVYVNDDKNELERRRLQSLESDPPEFDYLPEYTAGQLNHKSK
ncbi:hypothetical protein WICMUC_000325 [Wickerhamomyces mucosus]|uniref:pH-response regulator protein palF/RIM8 n=1 Tax=Wickerhamomyces mucosus TaxID=1378264 RepID=A0A9P8Q038_9ASCO|nr:hypothetical protein WICMUC_000325 [Wickerhamomyces mucosus]